MISFDKKKQVLVYPKKLLKMVVQKLVGNGKIGDKECLQT